MGMCPGARFSRRHKIAPQTVHSASRRDRIAPQTIHSASRRHRIAVHSASKRHRIAPQILHFTANLPAAKEDSDWEKYNPGEDQDGGKEVDDKTQTGRTPIPGTTPVAMSTATTGVKIPTLRKAAKSGPQRWKQQVVVNATMKATGLAKVKPTKATADESLANSLSSIHLNPHSKRAVTTTRDMVPNIKRDISEHEINDENNDMLTIAFRNTFCELFNRELTTWTVH
ncbi:hypothetical protein K439DRAFT_1612960 [Ramaria rubella]|nr:hypothetical protein K439DRAFT_1612960 [Ramaria rubella]